MRSGCVGLIVLVVLLGISASAPADDSGAPLGVAPAAPSTPPGGELPSLTDMSRMVQRMQGESPDALASPIKVLLLLTLLSIIPAVLILTTAFTRIVIVLSFIRNALTTRSVPPSQVIVGLSLFLTLFVMSPTLKAVNRVGIQPYLAGHLDAQQAIEAGAGPLREFMFSQTSDHDLAVFIGMSGMAAPETRADIPTHVLIPAFVIGELKKAFELGFVLFLPFLMIDLIVGSLLLSMGMIMLPPVMISAPLKVLLFVLVDGWHLVTESLMLSFGGV